MTNNAETTSRTYNPEHAYEYSEMMDFIGEHSPNAETVTNDDGTVTVTVTIPEAPMTNEAETKTSRPAAIAEPVRVVGDMDHVQVDGTWGTYVAPFGGSLTERVAKALSSVGYTLVGTLDQRGRGFAVPTRSIVWPRS